MRILTARIPRIAVFVIVLVSVLIGMSIEYYDSRSVLKVLLSAWVYLSPSFGAAYVVAMGGDKKYHRVLYQALTCAVTCFHIFIGLLIFYRLETSFTLDASLIRYNLNDAPKTLKFLYSNIYSLIAALGVLAWLFYLGLVQILEQIGRISPFTQGTFSRHREVVLLICGLTVMFLPWTFAESEVARFVAQFEKVAPVADRMYARAYARSIERNKSNHGVTMSSSETRNVFFVGLESVNALMVNKTNTPNYLTLAGELGVLHPRIQASDVLSIRAQESIFCSILPALKESLAQSRGLRDLVCLPRIFKAAGYKTFYFHSLPDIQFANTDEFMQQIGFDERHASGIMRPGDKQLQWGFAEEVYYQRVFEYLERYRGGKIFAYIHANTSNHYPFDNSQIRREYPQLTPKFPFPNATQFKERLANTMFVQDYLFGEMFRKQFQPRYGADSHMIVFGDHSWPIGLQAGNTVNWNNAFQDNLVSSLAFIPAARDRGKFQIGKQVNRLYSHLDILPTILDLYGVKGTSYSGRSFLGEWTGGAVLSSGRCLILKRSVDGR